MKFTSPNTRNVIQVEWLDIHQDSLRMIEWLGFDEPCFEFVTAHFEAEIIKQTPDARLLKLKLISTPDLTSRIKRDNSTTSLGMLNALTVRFPLEAKLLQGEIHWQLTADFTYRFENMAQATTLIKRAIDFTVLKAIRL